MLKTKYQHCIHNEATHLAHGQNISHLIALPFCDSHSKIQNSERLVRESPGQSIQLSMAVSLELFVSTLVPFLVVSFFLCFVLLGFFLREVLKGRKEMMEISRKAELLLENEEPFTNSYSLSDLEQPSSMPEQGNLYKDFPENHTSVEPNTDNLRIRIENEEIPSVPSLGDESKVSAEETASNSEDVDHDYMDVDEFIRTTSVSAAFSNEFKAQLESLFKKKNLVPHETLVEDDENGS